MLIELENLLPQLPDLIKDVGAWDSLVINRRKPITYRLFRYLPNNRRLCLHTFSPCDTHEAFHHPHPWPAAFKLLHGRYKMGVGYSDTRASTPHNVLTTVLAAGSMYEIINPLTWHSVIPLETTCTVMLNGEPWAPEIAHEQVKRTAGKDLDRLTVAEVEARLEYFGELLCQKG